MCVVSNPSLSLIHKTHPIGRSRRRNSFIVAFFRGRLVASQHSNVCDIQRTVPHLKTQNSQISSDGVHFTVDANVAKMSKLVELALDDDIFAEDTGADREVQLPKVTAAVMTKIIEFCEHYQTEGMTAIETPIRSTNIADMVQPFYVEYVNLERSMLFEIVCAANYMDIKPLMDLTCLAVTMMIKGMSVEEIRTIFTIENDLTPEDEAQIREENRWVDESIP